MPTLAQDALPVSAKDVYRIWLIEYRPSWFSSLENDHDANGGKGDETEDQQDLHRLPRSSSSSSDQEDEQVYWPCSQHETGERDEAQSNDCWTLFHVAIIEGI
jgi:hypothetical protein